MFKVKQLGIAGNVHRGIKKNWISNRKHRAVINGSASDWTPVTSGVPHVSVLKPVLFVIYINDNSVGLNNFLAIFADDTKIGNSVISDRTCSLQENLNKISAGSDRWEMFFNIYKCHILQVGARNQKCDYEICDVKLENVQCVKDLGVTTASNLKFFQHCKVSAGKANRMLAFINRNFSFKNKDITLPL